MDWADEKATEILEKVELPGDGIWRTQWLMLETDIANALREQQPCGHALADVVSSDEGTHFCNACRMQVEHDELVKLLALMFDKYENGDECYSAPEDFIGYAVRLDDEDFQRIADLLNKLAPREDAAAIRARKDG